MPQENLPEGEPSKSSLQKKRRPSPVHSLFIEWSMSNKHTARETGVIRQET